MTLPLYILRRFTEPGGNRLRKLPSLAESLPDIAGICPRCLGNVFYSRIQGVQAVNGIFRDTEFWHYGCAPNGGPAVESKATRKSRVPKGNLLPEEYRFWIGYKEPASKWARCRACRKEVFGDDKARTKHFSDPQFRVDGCQCTTRLVECYSKMEDVMACIVCKRQRFGNTKWGVPLCERPECHTEWMFSEERHISLEFRLRQQVKDADLKSPTGVGEWCTTCKLFTNQSGHEEIHNARLISGNVCGEC